MSKVESYLKLRDKTVDLSDLSFTTYQSKQIATRPTNVTHLSCLESGLRQYSQE